MPPNVCTTCFSCLGDNTMLFKTSTFRCSWKCCAWSLKHILVLYTLAVYPCTNHCCRWRCTSSGGRRIFSPSYGGRRDGARCAATHRGENIPAKEGRIEWVNSLKLCFFFPSTKRLEIARFLRKCCIDRCSRNDARKSPEHRKP